MKTIEEIRKSNAKFIKEWKKQQANKPKFSEHPDVIKTIEKRNKQYLKSLKNLSEEKQKKEMKKYIKGWEQICQDLIECDISAESFVNYFDK